MALDPTSIDFLRTLAARQGVEPTDEDLEAAGAFLETVLARLAEIEDALPPETPPAGTYLS